MVDKSKLEVNFKKKIKELVKHNKSYYSKNRPNVSDSEYDKLKKEILELEKNYKFLNHIKSPSKKFFSPPTSFTASSTQKLNVPINPGRLGD